MPDRTLSDDEKADFDEIRSWWKEKKERSLISRVASEVQRGVKGWGVPATLLFGVILVALVVGGLWFGGYLQFSRTASEEVRPAASTAPAAANKTGGDESLTNTERILGIESKGGKQ